eukprot:CAMPEP_0202968470 /NCGR_PEP_ID=MMETSP1396-20130829/13793_1 /ASSEMBLY_ACC=CAM_ASM_000872 /TAXON_ID= /ORGANISM="Pseudokeronopsis sp., Strain Brazil" /LENGTH=35 /DNA_ID= /DNA_START= /DNA_END= /DNA_ORIENTATION=
MTLPHNAMHMMDATQTAISQLQKAFQLEHWQRTSA